MTEHAHDAHRDARRQQAPLRMGAVCLCLTLLAAVAPTAPALAQGLPANGTTYLILGDAEQLPGGIGERVAAAGGVLTDAIAQIGLAVATSSDPDFATRASGLPGIRAIFPDALIPLAAASSMPVANPPSSGDDDELYDLQWALDAIDAPEAWAAGFRGAGARVAVLDTGIDVDHPDLVDNLNLELSTSFIPGVGLQAPPGPGIPIAGPLHHGTWVAGIVAAADNAIGTIGVAPEAELLALRVCYDEPPQEQPTGQCPSSAQLAGIVYAVDHGADVINLSIQHTVARSALRDEQGDIIDAAQIEAVLEVYRRAIRYANAGGATVIGIAGNEARNLDGDGSLVQLLPDLPGVIGVSATGPQSWGLDPSVILDQPAYYTNYGRAAVDFAAPGGNLDFDLLVPDPFDHLCTVVVTLPCVAFDGVAAPTADGWTFGWGTSAAAPHVAGVAALVIAANGGSMQPSKVASVLRSSSDDLGTSGTDPFYGNGRVNAAQAVP